MEDATDPSVTDVTMMCASQLIKTTILENIIGYFIDVDPSPILLVQPNETAAESFSKERLAPMVRDTPALARKVKEARTRDSGNTILMKSFPGGNIALVGANAPMRFGRPAAASSARRRDRSVPAKRRNGGRSLQPGRTPDGDVLECGHLSDLDSNDQRVLADRKGVRADGQAALVLSLPEMQSLPNVEMEPGEMGQASKEAQTAVA
jgi:hypothetical protein